MTHDIRAYYDRLHDIRPVEGEIIRIRGSISGPGSGKPIFTLRLRRGENVALGHFAAGSPLDWSQLEAYQGDKVVVTGRVYFDDIPGEYGIYARIGAPYLVDVTAIERLA